MPYPRARPNFASGIGPGDYEVRSVTAATTLVESDDLVLCNGTFTVTLPAAASFRHKRFSIKNVGSGAITVSAGSDTIDGSTTASLPAQYDALEVVSDGSDWWRIV